MNFKFTIFQILLSVLLSNLYAQDIRFEHITSENGLSNNNIKCIYQDKQGFIWIGTEDGLNRYDGYSFTVYKNIAEDSTSLSDNSINQIFEDSKGRFWIGTNDGGLDLLNRETGKFKHYKSKTNNQFSILNNHIVYIFQDSHKNLWIMCSNAGLNLYDPKTDNFKSINLPIVGTTREIINSRIFEDKQNIFWIAANTGLIKYSPQSGQIKKYQPQPNEKSEVSNKITVLVPLNDSVFLAVVNNKIFEYNKIRERFKEVNNSLSEYCSKYQILFVKNDLNNLLIGTYLGGLLKYNKTTNTFTSYLQNDCDPSSLSGNIVNTVYEDRFGSIWLGTYLNGLNKFEQVQKFNHSFKGQLVTAFFSNDKNKEWFGTQTSGLFNHDIKNNKLTNYVNNSSDANSLSSNSILSILKDQQDYLWVGTWENGINRAKVKLGTERKLKFEHLLGNESILCMVQDAKDRLWMGSNNNLFLYKPSENKFVKFPDENNLPKGIGGSSVQSIAVDQSGNLWLCTWNGLHHLVLPKDKEPAPDNVKITSYYNDEKNKNSLSDSRILSICISKKGTLWLGTYARGINKLEFDPEDNSKYKCTSYTQENGLPSNCVFGIQADENGLLWISTNKGFASFDPLMEKFIRYDKNDGLQGEDFLWRSSFKSPLGSMYFGGSNGYNSFLPGYINSNKNIPPVIITGFSIFNKPVVVGALGSPLNKNISSTKKITIHHDQSMISFDFTALNYILTYKNKYKYKMQGFDKDWVNAGSERKATYTNLNPGTYTFIVIASNNDDVWNKEGASVKITVLPSWWETWWFRTLTVLIIIICLFGFYHWRIRILKRQKKQIEIIVEEKTREVLIQKEELQAINEEVSASNEELFNQREEMQTLNEELTSANDELNSRQEELESILQSLKDAQNQLIQSEKMASLGVLSAGVAHEINNPLNFIQGGILGLENYLSEHLNEHLAELEPLLNGMHIGVSRAAAIVTSLNHYSRRDDNPLTECDCHSIIDNCLVILQNQTKNRIEIIKQYCDHKHRIIGNEGKLHQALLNILANASQAIDNKGTIRITTDIENELFVISIEDNGCGISDDNLSKIMDPFFTTKEPGKGTGLGLSITYNIIKEHNGTIEFSSKIGIGTKMTIKLIHNLK